MSTVSYPSVTLPSTRHLWSVSIVLWVVGDALTTIVGLQLGAVERSPLAAIAIGEFGLLSILLLKLLALGLFGILYLSVRRRKEVWSIGIPVGLALLGAAVTAHNSVTLARVLL